MLDRTEHQQEIHAFLQNHLSINDWSFSLPHGSGMESYFAQGNGKSYFVKLGVQVERYLLMAELGFTPEVLVHGKLESGSSIIVQPLILGRSPSRVDYRDRLADVAELIGKAHHEPRLQEALPAPPTGSHKEAGVRALGHLQQTRSLYRAQVPSVAKFIDQGLERLAHQIDQFSREGLVASHGDICNANWLFGSNGKIYLLDFESMAMDDPAFDMGALLWWYYPPRLRQQFLEIAGYHYDDEFRFRMQTRMAMHCLSITLPREGSFDDFDANTYPESLADFRAILNGEENPQGYDE